MAFFAFLLLALPLGAHAAVELFVWQVGDHGPRVILPRRSDETPEAALRLYLANIDRDVDLRGLLPKGGILMGEPSFSVFPTSPSLTKPRLAFIANWMEDMRVDGERIGRNLNWASQLGADPYVIALSADLGLSAWDRAEFHQKVVEAMDLLFSLGGNDIETTLYGQEPMYVEERMSLTRDRSELALVRAFKKAAKGLFVGICRGHQMGAIADGHEIVQDLTQTGFGKTEDHVRAEGLSSADKQIWHHISLQIDSLFGRFLRGYIAENQIEVRDGEVEILVNSVHHQVATLTQDGDSFATAWHPTSGVEALQGRNGKSVSAQFHLEFPEEVSGNAKFSKFGRTILRGVVAYARLLRQQYNATHRGAPRCEQVFR